MVARPSLKRVVPGSVPPWRALCAESARALKAFFSILCVSKSVLLLESKFGQILRALNLRAFWVRPSCPRVGRGRGGAPPQLLWPSGRASAGGPGLFSSCERVFFVAPSLPQRFSWPLRGFPLPAIKKARQPFVIITLDPLSEHFRGRNALGFARRRTSKLAGRCG